MGRSLDEVIASLPAAERERVERRYRELSQEVESLRELRRLAGRAQTDVAAALKIAQPSVSKIEKQADMYLSTLRGYVEAVGGTLDLVVRLPGREPLRLEHFRDATVAGLDKPPLRSPRRGTRPGVKAARASGTPAHRDY